MSQSEHLIVLRDCGGAKPLLGNNSITSSDGPGGNGSVVHTRAWNAALARQTHRVQTTATGIFHFQAMNAVIVQADMGGLMPLMPPSDQIYRIREGIAGEYVSGPGVSRVFWGLFKTWTDDLLGQPGMALDPGAIGFLWWQDGAVGTNWRAVAADHAGNNRFDVDTGKPAQLIPYNFRIDFDGRVGERKILYYVDEVLVATYTPDDDELQGTLTSQVKLGMGVNAENGNVCAGHKQMLSEHGIASIIQTGGPDV
jgi:hypothetical protein